MSISRIPAVAPRNTYSFSDTFGGSSDPLNSPDADALISKDLDGEPWQKHGREFDIFGREGSIRHLIRLLISLHDQHRYLRWRHLYTGVLINHQEDGRIERGQNGHEFYVVETDNNIRIVVSPLDDLASIRDRIKTVERLPNANSLFSGVEQFRSKRAPRLLARDHGYEGELVGSSAAAIPDDPLCGTLRTSYVDRYGNVLAWKEGGIEEEREQLSERFGKVIGVRFGDGTTQEACVTDALANGVNGRLNVYANGENIDFVGKWDRGYDIAQKRERSAYVKFGKPIENVTPVYFDW